MWSQTWGAKMWVNGLGHARWTQTMLWQMLTSIGMKLFFCGTNLFFLKGKLFLQRGSHCHTTKFFCFFLLPKSPFIHQPFIVLCEFLQCEDFFWLSLFYLWTVGQTILTDQRIHWETVIKSSRLINSKTIVICDTIWG